MNTTYYFRLVAVGLGGNLYGSDRSFTTRRIPLALTIATAPHPVVFGKLLNIRGTLSGTDNANREVTLQINPLPFTAASTTSEVGSSSRQIPQADSRSQWTG